MLLVGFLRLVLVTDILKSSIITGIRSSMDRSNALASVVMIVKE